jgi:hypothetical protein
MAGSMASWTPESRDAFCAQSIACHRMGCCIAELKRDVVNAILRKLYDIYDVVVTIAG